MRLRNALACVAIFMSGVVCGIGIRPASAHHVVGNGGATTGSLNPYFSRSRPPQTSLDFSFTFDRLDGGLGDVLGYQIAGEYSVHRRIGIGARIPVLTIRQQFLPDTDRLGDVAVSGKGLIGEWPLHRMFLAAGTEISFPTGSESRGTGTGDVMLSPYLTLSKGFGWLTALATAGSTFAAAGDAHLSIDCAASLVVPVVRGALPVDFLLSFQGSTTTSSQTFTSGSTKAYAKLALVFHPKPNLTTALGAKVSMIDTLSVKPGIALSRLSTAPLSDVEAGFLLDINYSF